MSGGSMQIGVSIHDADEIGVPRLAQSHVAHQGVVTRFEINGAGIAAYAGYGCPPAALSARLRGLADQIDAAAAAMTPTQGDAVEAARTEGDAHQPAPASAVCDGGDSQDVAGAVVEADPAQEGDGVGAGPATAAGRCPNCDHDDHYGERCDGLTEDHGDWCACSWPDASNFVQPPGDPATAQLVEGRSADAIVTEYVTHNEAPAS